MKHPSTLTQDPIHLTGTIYVAVPTAGDLITAEERKGDPNILLWYLQRFMVDESGRPWLRDEDEARKVEAGVAQAVVDKVTELVAKRP